jgi:hypothetical protein
MHQLANLKAKSMQNTKPTADTEVPDKAREEVETILGRDVTVTFDDPKQPAETVTVKKVALRHIARFANVITVDEASEIGFYTGKPSAWAESLSEESITQLLEAGRALNRKRFENFALRATRFDNEMRRSSPELAQLAESAQQAMMLSRSPAASNT